MGSIRKMMGAMLMSLALTAFMSDMDAQTRRSSDVKKSTPARQSSGRSSSPSRSSSSPSRSSSSPSRSSSSSQRTSSPSRSTSTSSSRSSSSQTRRSSSEKKQPATVSRPSDQTRPSSQTRPGNRVSPGSQTRPSGQVRPSDQTRPSSQMKPGAQNKPGQQVARPGQDKPSYKPRKPVQIRPDHKPDMHRVHPRDRDYIRWNRPSHYWSHHNHCFGHRVRVLPTHVHRHIYYGVTYYCYNDVWYRPYGGYYVICRPPYGIALAADIIADMAWTAVRLSYYNTVVNTYSQINENNAYIAEQNAIIAQNNATIAAQNAAISQSRNLAQASYSLANSLGLVQSYGAAGTDYFYQDGVFYTMDASGQYKVILPPAGALVETLPDDYDMVTLRDGKEYYKVEDTVYRVTISEGKPYFEVLGQQY